MTKKAVRRSWGDLSRIAGKPTRRYYEQNPRLFGHDKPQVVLWRDNSAWCPYCLKLWLLLEVMELPYEMKTIPLQRYLKPGESKPREYTDMVPSGVVPALQLRDGETFGAPIERVHSIFELLREHPGFPEGDPRLYEMVCRPGGVRDKFEVARRAYEACAGAPDSSWRRPDYFESTGLLDACAALDDVLAISGGPFVCGREFTAADCQLVPLLERAEAVAPYFFGGPDRVFPGTTFDGARRLLDEARRTTVFKHHASDSTTLARTNLRYATRFFRPLDAEYARIVDANPDWKRDATRDHKREAAARLCANYKAVAKFASRCAQVDVEDDVVQHVLRITATALLLGDDAAADAARDMCSAVGPAPARAAAASLLELSLNVGVPRDMDLGPANALRAYSRFVADLLLVQLRGGGGGGDS
ncbi:hypothetical protein CTAYLR_009371 [Chrysophaeum taylorii]|uniref:GST N-terminal domain-containing protein n=1 Tax=Chrysophaeum taylorii TaxID=2483200 RepID=A0AAD7UBR1_9STRA|nr:hypothetical protein CTAYLR_009371 [Chrysophaeum taylorii]